MVTVPVSRHLLTDATATAYWYSVAEPTTTGTYPVVRHPQAFVLLGAVAASLRAAVGPASAGRKGWPGCRGTGPRATRRAGPGRCAVRHPSACRSPRTAARDVVARLADRARAIRTIRKPMSRRSWPAGRDWRRRGAQRALRPGAA